MGDLLSEFKSTAGDAWQDGWAEKLKPMVDEAIGSAASAAVAKAVDEEKAKRLQADKARKETAAKVKQLEEQLAGAGDVDAALDAARKATAEAQAERDRLASELRQRKIASAARKALEGHKLEDGSAIPQERLDAARRLMSLDGVDLDEDGNAVGIEASVTALHSSEPWLWKPDSEDKRGGHGGKRQGADPPPKPPPPKDETPRQLGGDLCELALNRGKRPEAQA